MIFEMSRATYIKQHPALSELFHPAALLYVDAFCISVLSSSQLHELAVNKQKLHSVSSAPDKKG